MSYSMVDNLILKYSTMASEEGSSSFASFASFAPFAPFASFAAFASFPCFLSGLTHPRIQSVHSMELYSLALEAFEFGSLFLT
jgi:hypothetical protein